MALRAPKREDRPTYTDREHTVDGHWEPTKWLRVLRADGSLLMETSNEAEATEAAQVNHRTLERRWQFVPAVVQYRRVTGLAQSDSNVNRDSEQ